MDGGDGVGDEAHNGNDDGDVEGEVCDCHGHGDDGDCDEADVGDDQSHDDEHDDVRHRRFVFVAARLAGAPVATAWGDHG